MRLCSRGCGSWAGRASAGSRARFWKWKTDGVVAARKTRRCPITAIGLRDGCAFARGRRKFPD